MFYQFRAIKPGEFFVIGSDTSMGSGDWCVSQFVSKNYKDVPLVYRTRGSAIEMTNELQPMLERLFDITGIKPVIAYERNNGGAFELERLGALNRLSKYKLFEMYENEGKIETGQPKVYGWDCVCPETLVLKSDLSWVSADCLQVSDVLAGVTENTTSGSPYRRFINQKIIGIKSFNAQIYKIKLKNGVILRVSNNHPFLSNRLKYPERGAEWKKAEDLKLTDALYYIGTWEPIKTYDAGRLSGLLDGEGYITTCINQINKRKYGLNLMIAQSEGVLSNEIKELWIKTGFTPNRKYVKHASPDRAHHKTMTYTGVGKKLSAIEALGKLRPVRLIDKFKDNNLISSMTTCNIPRIGIESIEKECESRVVGIETDGHTLITNGVISHNTNTATRPKMLGDLKQAIDNRLLKVYDEETIKEMFSFIKVQTNTLWKAQAEKGMHDDHVMALAIAWQIYISTPSVMQVQQYRPVGDLKQFPRVDRLKRQGNQFKRFNH